MPVIKKIAAEAAFRRCPGCRRRMRVARKSARYSSDGSATVDLICSRCRIKCIHYWDWK